MHDKILCINCDRRTCIGSSRFTCNARVYHSSGMFVNVPGETWTMTDQEILQKLNSIAHTKDHWGAVNIDAEEVRTIAKRFAELTSQNDKGTKNV